MRLLMAGVVIAVIMAAPIVYVETACRAGGTPEPYQALLPADHHRVETRTLMTYPEWHIVHAYEDYAEVVRRSDPHAFGYLRSIGDFWSSLCALSETSAQYGTVDGETKQMVYVIGLSFSTELLFKALYEESVGRLFAMLRGQERAPLDDLSAQQAANYATFLQQVPWYKWRFREDAADLKAQATDAVRDQERRIALGLEYAAKASYADAIAAAVASVGADELTLRMVVTNTDAAELAGIPDVKPIGMRPQGMEIETPRYRALTHLLVKMADSGIDFVEIAGNDDILFTALSSQAQVNDALFSFPRQGFDDHRHLIVVKVTDLAERLRNLEASGLTLEHVHDY